MGSCASRREPVRRAVRAMHRCSPPASVPRLCIENRSAPLTKFCNFRSARGLKIAGRPDSSMSSVIAGELSSPHASLMTLRIRYHEGRRARDTIFYRGLRLFAADISFQKVPCNLDAAPNRQRRFSSYWDSPPRFWDSLRSWDKTPIFQFSAGASAPRHRS